MKGYIMRARRILFAVKNLRVGILTIGVVLVAGCSTGMSRVQTWEGTAESTAESTESVAVLSTPGVIKIQEVNGQPMSSFLIDNMSVDYELLPVKNRVVFTYKTIWSKSEAVEDGESKVHVVETPRQTVTIDARPGETYRFDIEKPKTRKQAEAYAEDFSVAVINSSGQTVATSSPFVAGAGQPTAARSPVPGSDSAPANASSGSTLEQLKSLWGEASEDEKRQFLRWAFE